MTAPAPQPERMTAEEVRGLFRDMIHILTEQNLVILKLNTSMIKIEEEMEKLIDQNARLGRIALKAHGIDPDTMKRIEEEGD
jgi:hypothetical protein